MSRFPSQYIRQKQTNDQSPAVRIPHSYLARSTRTHPYVLFHSHSAALVIDDNLWEGDMNMFDIKPGTNRIDKFRRSPLSHRKYLSYIHDLKSNYGSVMDYVRDERLSVDGYGAES